MLLQPDAFARAPERAAPLAQDAQGYCVSEAERSAFERDGVVCLRQVLPGATVAELAVALDTLSREIDSSAAGYDVTKIRRRLYDAPDASVQPAGNGRQYDRELVAQSLRESRAPALLDSGASGAGRFLVDSSTWHRDRTIQRLALDSELPGVAAQLLGAHKINFCDDQIFVKTQGAADRTAFHQDYTYFRMRGWQGCVMWICVDPADADAGALAYVRGSHRWGREFAPNMFFAQIGIPGSSGESLEAIEADPERHDLVRFEVEPGDIVIHHFRTVHGAGGNRSSHARRALSLRYAGDDMRYWRRPGTPEQPYQHHALRDGDPLDSEAFPVVWPRPFPGFSLADAYYNRLASAA
ncbi:MAG: phytanoyl-CoA dioxygenase family protein [Rhizomicrobium sp.]